MKAIKLIFLGVSLFSILPLGAQVFDKPRSLRLIVWIGCSIVCSTS